jgi:hypothetical protein
MRTAYGSEDPVYNEGLIKSADEAILGMIESLLPGKMLVGLFHPLQYVPSWLPGAGWKRTLEGLAAMNEDLRLRPFNDTKVRVVSASDVRCRTTLLTTSARIIGEGGSVKQDCQSRHRVDARPSRSIFP